MTYRKLQPRDFFFFCLSLLIFAGGCAAPRKQVAKRVEDLQVEWKTNILYQAQLPERTLDWGTALTLLRESNLKLRQARTEMTNAQEAVRQVFRDLVPTLNLHAGVSKRVVDLPSVGSEDVTFSANSILNIPGVVSFNSRLYMTRLYQLRAETAYALAEREQIIELYKLFWAAQDVEEQSGFISNQKETARSYETVDPFTGQLLLTETELRELANQQERQTLHQRASELLGSRQYRWRFQTNGLPNLLLRD
jgi:hypothetical protein